MRLGVWGAAVSVVETTSQAPGTGGRWAVPAPLCIPGRACQVPDMQRREFLVATALGAAGLGSGRMPSDHPGPDDTFDASSIASMPAPTRKILIAGGGFNRAFIRYMAALSGKPCPRICYLPTASADSADGIINFYRECAGLDVEPHVQRSFIESLSQTQGWDDVLLSMDGIVCSGGNTLNQQAIWKAQGIDVVLRAAWEKGVVLGGASAGSLCWFEEGTTDSRPKVLSIVTCLGFLAGSHSPHYDKEPGRRPLYQQLIGSGTMKPGYACDNDAGIYFEDTSVKRVVSTRADAKVYYVSVVNGAVVERTMEPERIS